MLSVKDRNTVRHLITHLKRFEKQFKARHVCINCLQALTISCDCERSCSVAAHGQLNCDIDDGLSLLVRHTPKKKTG